MRNLIVFTLLLTFFVSTDLLAQKKNKNEKKQDFKFENAVKAGDEQFKNEFYKDALKFYEIALKIDNSNSYVNYQVAECNRLLFRYQYAGLYYDIVASLDFDNYPQAMFYSAWIEKISGRYKNAISSFEDFLTVAKQLDTTKFKDQKYFFQRALIEMEGCYWSLEQMANHDHYNMLPPINTMYDDFAPTMLIEDSIIIVSSRRPINLLAPKNEDGDVSTGNYAFSRKHKIWNETDLPQNLSIVNTTFNDGPGCFNNKQTKYYFTRCGEGDTYCKIYLTEFKDGKWSDPKPLNSNINAPSCDNMHPALSISGDTMFFSSRREGGRGENDLWLSVKTGSGDDWGVAQNLGNEINTSQNEISPYYYFPERCLFFASDGLKGFGGQDIYYASGNLMNHPIVTNISIPFNSNYDDCYLVLGEKKGYLSSNRTGGMGDFDVYCFDNLFIKNEKVDYQAKLQSLRDDLSKKFSSPLDSSVVNIKRDVINETGFNTSVGVNFDKYALYERLVAWKVAQHVYSQQVPYIEYDNTLFKSLNQDDLRIVEMMYQAKIKNLTPDDIAIFRRDDVTNYEMLEGKEKLFIDLTSAAVVTNSKNDFVKLSNPDDNDFYARINLLQKYRIDRLLLSRMYKKAGKEKADDQKIFGFVINASGCKSVNIIGKLSSVDSKLSGNNITIYLKDQDDNIIESTATDGKENFNFSNLGPNKRYSIFAERMRKGEQPVAEYYVKDFIAKCGEQTASVSLNATVFGNIYFNYNTYQIENQQTKILDELTGEYLKNRSMKIFIKGYTDNVGTDRYNLYLSEKRAKSAYLYLVSKGVDKQSIRIIGEGESKPIATNETSKGRSLNRRIEFSILQK